MGEKSGQVTCTINIFLATRATMKFVQLRSPRVA